MSDRKMVMNNSEIIVQEPKIIDQLFNEEKYQKLKDYLFNKKRELDQYEVYYGRYVYTDQLINQYGNDLIPIARKIFNSETLVPSYFLFAHYEKDSKLHFHKDNNACTYTIDMCVYQTEPWDLWVEDKPYTLMPNQALAYYGNDQVHGRKEFPDKKNGYVAMIFFHFVEPDHWFITKGPEYMRDQIRKMKNDE